MSAPITTCQLQNILAGGKSTGRGALFFCVSCREANENVHAVRRTKITIPGGWKYAGFYGRVAEND